MWMATSYSSSSAAWLTTLVRLRSRPGGCLRDSLDRRRRGRGCGRWRCGPGRRSTLLGQADRHVDVHRVGRRSRGGPGFPVLVSQQGGNPLVADPEPSGDLAAGCALGAELTGQRGTKAVATDCRCRRLRPSSSTTVGEGWRSRIVDHASPSRVVVASARARRAIWRCSSAARSALAEVLQSGVRHPPRLVFCDRDGPECRTVTTRQLRLPKKSPRLHAAAVRVRLARPSAVGAASSTGRIAARSPRPRRRRRRSQKRASISIPVEPFTSLKP